MSKRLTIGYDQSDLQDIPVLVVGDTTSNMYHTKIINTYHSDWAVFIFKLLTGEILSPEFEKELYKFCDEHGILWDYKIDTVGYVSFKFDSLEIGKEKPYVYGERIEAVILYPEGVLKTLKEKLIGFYNIEVKTLKFFKTNRKNESSLDK